MVPNSNDVTAETRALPQLEPGALNPATRTGLAGPLQPLSRHPKLKFHPSYQADQRL